MTRSKFYAPNSFEDTHLRWRTSLRERAIGVLTVNSGLASGKHLAAVLGISPRGLRQVMLRDAMFIPEIRESENGRGETWYRLNYSALPKAPKPPRLISSVGGSICIDAPAKNNCKPVTREQRVK